ncbi:MAG: InlB B-repeat-containing protein, partial [Lachnospiraceae bacterium]|nr:InlB B-repeat-containing protein [Lachnospiraceae bacterium]
AHFTLKPTLEGFAGVGICKTAAVGGFLSGGADFDYLLASTKSNPRVEKLDAIFKAGLKAYIGPFEYKKTYGQATYHLLPGTDNPKGSGGGGGGSWSTTLVSGIYDLDNYNLIDRSYLERQSDWQGLYLQEEAVSGENESQINTLNGLVSNTYGASSPKIITNGSDTIMVYVGDDSERSDCNMSRVMYSIFNSQNNTWSVPKQLDNNQTPDYMPQLYTDGSDIYAIYVDSAKVFGDETEINNMTPYYEIAVSKFDSVKSAFEEPYRITGIYEQATGNEIESLSENDILEGNTGEESVIEKEITSNLDGEETVVSGNYSASEQFQSVPRMTSINGAPVVVWVSNTNSDYFGRNNTNQILYRTYENDKWSETKVWKENLSSIIGLEVQGDKILYLLDKDNDLNTMSDRELYTATLGDESVKLAEGEISAPCFGTIKGKANSMVWYGSNNLHYVQNAADTPADVFETVPANLTDSYELFDDEIIFIGVDGKGGSNFYSVVYDSQKNSYSDAVQLTSQDLYLHDANTVKAGNKRLCVFMQSDYADTGEVDNMGWAYLNGVHDLAVTGISYDYEAVSQNKIIPLNVTIQNKGDSVVSSIKTDIYNAANVNVATSTINEQWEPGEVKTVTVNFTVPSEITTEEYQLSVGEDGETDAIASNNRKSFSVGNTNLKMSTEQVCFNGNYGTNVSIRNTSHVTAENAVLNVYVNDNQTPIYKETIGNIKEGETSYSVIKLNSEWIDEDAKDALLTYSVSCNTAEYYQYDNSSSEYYHITYSAVFDSQGGSIYDPVTVERGKAINELPIPEKEGYLFAGWYTGENGTGSKITEKTKITKDVTLYAKWISSSEAKNIHDMTIIKPKSQVIYTGNAVKPNLIVKDGKIKLQEGTDYIVGYRNNVNAGQDAKAIIYGMRDYAGSQTISFNIIPKKLPTTNMEAVDMVYQGVAVTPKIKVYDNGTLLVQDTDYTVEDLKNNNKAGAASCTIKGKGNYTGSKKIKFTIFPQNTVLVNTMKIEPVNETTYTYTGKAIKPQITVKDVSGNEINKKNYTVIYKNNKNAGLASIVIKGKGKLYKGTQIYYFTIKPINLVGNYGIGEIPSYSFTGSIINPPFKVINNNTKKKLAAKNNYEISYEDNLLVGNSATITITGIKNYTGSITKSFTINNTGFSKKFSVKGLKTQKYTGSAIEPKISIVYCKRTLKLGRDYTVAYQNNTERGTAKVIINAVDGSGFTGSIEKVFKIK